MLHIEGVYHDVEPHWSTENAKGLNTLVYVTEGCVNYFIENKRIELKKGEVLWIPYHLLRAWSNHKDVVHKKYTVLFTVPVQTKAFPPLFHRREDYFIFKPRNIAYYEQRLSFMYIQWLGQRKFYQELSSNILSELLWLIAQEKLEQKASPNKEQIVRKLQEHILYHFRQSITIEELAEIAGITPNYVTVLFKEVIGVTPIQYLHQIRVNTAWNLLTNTQMTVKEAAEYLGYCDQSYFNRMFKKWMGTAPSRVKAEKRG